MKTDRPATPIQLPNQCRPKKKRGKELLKGVREQERAVAELPAPLPVLKGLLDWLDANIDECDDTLRRTLEYIHQNNLDEAGIVEWLERYGRFCDCEVLANVEDSNPALRS